jgi:hypothetical protein
MNPDRIEEGLARLRTAPPSPALRTRVLAVARNEWTRRSTARRAFRAAAWRWAAAVAAVWAVCIGFTLREDHLTTHAFAASRPAAPARGDDGVAAILKESGLSATYARLWTTAPHIPSRTDSWAALRQAMAL